MLCSLTRVLGAIRHLGPALMNAGGTMRGYAYRLKRHMARHRRLWLAGSLAVAGLIVVVGALYFGAPDNSPIALSPPATYDARWSFRELQSQIDGGHVVSVTVAGNAQNQSSLLANTTDHKVAAIDLSTNAADAAAALVALGYRDLLTPAAWAAIDARTPSSTGGTSDMVRNAMNIGFLVVMLGLLAILLLRMRSSGLLEIRRGQRFATIMPASPANAKAAKAAPATSSVVAAATSSSGDVRLSDVAGCEEAKLELAEAIEFLRDPQHFPRIGRAGAARRSAFRAARHRQDHARARCCH